MLENLGCSPPPKLAPRPYAFKNRGDTSLWHFDTFETEDARQAHINGEIPKVLASVAPELLAELIPISDQ